MIGFLVVGVLLTLVNVVAVYVAHHDYRKIKELMELSDSHRKNISNTVESMWYRISEIDKRLIKHIDMFNAAYNWTEEIKPRHMKDK